MSSRPAAAYADRHGTGRAGHDGAAAPGGAGSGPGGGLEHARLTGRLDAARSALAGELTRLANEVGTTRGELTELHEVISAAERASAALAGASRHLDSAGNWATYDTFGGGGFFADMMKRQKMDQAVELMRNADESLRAPSRELGDLGRDGVGGIEADGLIGTFDVWFDDIFNDWTVMNRINEARDRVREALDTVGRVHQGAVERAAALEVRLAQLAERREQLLTGA
ncbi:hypothetical protein [Promicromonospora panici]|uniref:hypothetical protein n=1 Tax=Promicromonospora panici TaxID=2219658 RepID=UPI00101E009D|nr:hypothetical protein [Promicromonospora panici]